MSYQTLACKWRPRNFSDVVGQEYVMKALMNSLSSGRIHHAYLFSGTRGVGKTSIARLLAKGLSCEKGVTAIPCSLCTNCSEIEQGHFVDLIEIDAASRTKVEDTRDLLDNAQYAPAHGRFKIYLIDEVHMLSRYSFNAMLKTLEEPPSHVKFLLATTDPQKLPITILSRCLQFYLKTIDVELIYHRLKYILDKEQMEYEPLALQLLARAADGSLRDALSLVDQAIISSSSSKLSADTVNIMLGTMDKDHAISLIEVIAASDSKRAMELVDEAASRGIEWEELLIEMQSLLHRIAMIQLHSSTLVIDRRTDDTEYRIHELAHTISPTDIQLYYQTLLVGRKELPFAPNKRMGVEMTLLRALAFHPKTPTSEQSPSQSNISPLDADRQMITACSQFRCTQWKNKLKGNNLKESNRLLLIDSAAKHQESMIEYIKSLSSNFVLSEKIPEEKDIYKRKFVSSSCQKVNKEIVAEQLTKNFKHKKASKLITKSTCKTINKDSWLEKISKLRLPKSIEQVVLNAYTYIKERDSNQVRLYLRPEQYHLDLPKIKKILMEAFTTLYGKSIELIIIDEDDLSNIKTPLKHRQIIYQEKLAQAREIIIKDNNILMLQRIFNAELDKESIHPI